MKRNHYESTLKLPPYRDFRAPDGPKLYEVQPKPASNVVAIKKPKVRRHE